MFPLYLAGGLFLEFLVYLLDTSAYGGRNTTSSKTIELIFLGAAVCFLIGLGLSYATAKRLGPGRPSLLSSRRTLAKVANAVGLVIGLGLVFWICARLSIAGEESRVRSKSAAVKGPAPNLILLVVDALRADRLSSNGYELETTPGLDLLAAAGAAFPSTMAASSWTLPAHASLFTGLYPSRHGAYSRSSQLGHSSPTLAEILARNGYYTLSIYANPLLGSDTGLDRGFDAALGVGNRQKTSLTLVRLYRKFLGRGSTAEEILDISLRWIARCRELRVPYLFHECPRGSCPLPTPRALFPGVLPAILEEKSPGRSSDN